MRILGLTEKQEREIQHQLQRCNPIRMSNEMFYITQRVYTGYDSIPTVEISRVPNLKRGAGK